MTEQGSLKKFYCPCFPPMLPLRRAHSTRVFLGFSMLLTFSTRESSNTSLEDQAAAEHVWKSRDSWHFADRCPATNIIDEQSPKVVPTIREFGWKKHDVAAAFCATVLPRRTRQRTKCFIEDMVSQFKCSKLRLILVGS